MPYKLTAELVAAMGKDKDLMAVSTESEFGRAVFEIFRELRPRKIIETGTYLGTGTTAIIGRALQELRIEQPEFYSIEVNVKHFREAYQNVQRQRLAVHLLHGLSIPRSMLPTRDEIQRDTVEHQVDGIYVDWPERFRAEAYFREVSFPDGADDLLGRCLERFSFAPDFVLLDSAGHVGYTEFRYVTDRLRARCVLALDDTNHVKHYRSVQELRIDKRFKVMAESKEKFGFCIAAFEPNI